jgi:membrane associated rhomboid family serine protease
LEGIALMFPLKVNRKISSFPVITYLLIALNVIVFIWQTTLSTGQTTELFLTAGFVPCKVSATFFTFDSFLTFFTSAFLHADIIHLLSNMLFLFVFGPAVEDYLGKLWYPVFYFAAAFGSGLLHMFLAGSCIPTIGASGAIMGVMGGFLLLYPGTRVSSLVLLGRIPLGLRHVRSLYILGTFFVLDLLNGLIVLSNSNVQPSVAVWGHIGGFLVGFLMAFIAMTFKPLPPVDPIYMDED